MNDLDFLDDNTLTPITWQVRKSQFIGDTLLHSKHIIPTDVFVADRVQEIYTLDYKLEIQSQEVKSLIRDVEKYFKEVRTERFNEATNSTYYYTDDREDLIAKIDDVMATRLVRIDHLIDYLGEVMKRLSIGTTLNLEPNDTRTLKRINFLSNALEQNESSITMMHLEIDKLTCNLNQLDQLKSTFSAESILAKTEM